MMKRRLYSTLPLILTIFACNNTSLNNIPKDDYSSTDTSQLPSEKSIEKTDDETHDVQITYPTITPLNYTKQPVQCLKTSDCKIDEYCQLKTQTCLKKCVEDRDCKDSDKPDGEACRSDGRCSPKVFETIIEITKPSQAVVLPSYDAAYGGSHVKNFQILWGDEPETEKLWEQTIINAYTPPSGFKLVSHRYATPGRYHVRILGTYNGWGDTSVRDICDPPILKAIDDSGDPRFPIVEVVSFGDVGLAPGAFRGTKLNKLPETDVPNANKLTRLDRFFENTDIFNQPIYWDTANVISTSSMFTGAKKYNQPLRFDTSIVRNFSAMFADAESFNAPVEMDTSNARDMEWMFSGAISFNQPVEFNTSHVFTMEGMFAGAIRFNQPVHFDTGNVATFVSMFGNAKAFSQPLRFDIGSATTFECMFEGATNLNKEAVFLNTPIEFASDKRVSAFESVPALAWAERRRQSIDGACHSFWEDDDYDYDYGGKYGAYEKASIHVLTPALRPRNQHTEYEAEVGRDGEYDENGVCQGEEGCRCGDGFCGYLGKCVEGVCQCGAYDRRRGIFVGKKSNDFYDFKCEVWQQADPGGKAVKVPAYHWVCDDTDGCSYRGWVYPYRAYFGDKTTPNGKEAFSDYEIAHGVFDRVLSPEDAMRAKERGIDYDESVAADGRCSVRQVRHPGKGVFGEAQCRKITPEYRACEDAFCACGGSICAKGYMCDDTFECVCAREDGCGCNDRYILWGMGCKDGVPQCNGKPEPKPEGKHVCSALSDAGDDFGWAER